MSQPEQDQPDWMGNEDQRAADLANSEQEVTNTKASKPKRRKVKQKEEERPLRTLKGFRLRTDYQMRFDELAAREKHLSGKKGPDLIEEALQMLFRKYDKKTIG